MTSQYGQENKHYIYIESKKFQNWGGTLNIGLLIERGTPPPIKNTDIWIWISIYLCSKKTKAETKVEGK